MIHPPPSPAVESLIQIAAEMRATGSQWQSVGEKVGRSPETCRRWPALHPELWKRCFRAAAVQFAEDCATEARVFLRVLARSKDERVCLQACKLLLHTCADLRRLEADGPAAEPAEETDAVRFAHYMDSLGPEEQQQHTEQLYGILERRYVDQGWTPPPGHPLAAKAPAAKPESPAEEFTWREPEEPSSIGGLKVTCEHLSLVPEAPGEGTKPQARAFGGNPSDLGQRPGPGSPSG